MLLALWSTLALGLTLGDPAPPLAVDAWLQGGLQAEDLGRDDKVWVLDFWAAWCGPCIESWPHVSSLAEHYAGEVQFVAVTADAGEPLALLERYVKQHAEKLRIPVAHDLDGHTADAYMLGLGQTAIPLSVIVDRHGNIAWAGHPGLLDVPLAMVVGGHGLPHGEQARVRAPTPRIGQPLPVLDIAWESRTLQPGARAIAFTVVEGAISGEEHSTLARLARRFTGLAEIEALVSGPEDGQAAAASLARSHPDLRVTWDEDGALLAQWAPLLLQAGGPAVAVADDQQRLVWVGPVSLLDQVLVRVVSQTHGYRGGGYVEDFEASWQQAVAASDWEQVLALLDDIAVETESPEAWLVLRRQALVALGRTAEAEDTTLRLLAVTEDRTRVLDEGSTLIGASAGPMLLEAALRAASRLEPDWELWFLRARLHRALGERKPSLDALSQAQALAPEAQRRGLRARYRRWRRDR